MKEAQAVLEAIETGRHGEVLTRGDAASWRRVARLLHPDMAAANGIDADRASTAFAAASAWFQGAASGPTVTLTTKTTSYALGAKIADGSSSVLYRAKAGDGNTVVAKMARKPANNDLLDAERDALTDLAGIVAQHDWLTMRYPRLLDSLRHRDAGTRAVRRVNILNDLTDGWYSLAQVKQAYPNGLDGRDWAWMHRRLLFAIGGAELAGRVHGAIVAENVLIHPAWHELALVGWSFSVKSGARLDAKIGSKIDRYAPEAIDGPVTTATDLYMAHRLMLDMLAGTEREQRDFAARVTTDSPGRRPDVASLLVSYDELVVRLYGPKKFRPFTMPATA